MTARDRNSGRPLEESPEVRSAVRDESTVPQLATDGGADPDTPTFTAPGEKPTDRSDTEDLLGDPYGAGSNNAAGYRTGAEQPWEAEDLAKARGQDPTPTNVERARHDLDEDGRAAVERTVP
ncbi:hypothetical protein [Micromonospora zhanjiangensis]|uniref:DUF5709 domain-containing protein n=1 Tax=Micromonospora zhanjiangensis TaxID=1522057 RepID=A0ABV8KLS5_9ACTN